MISETSLLSGIAKVSLLIGALAWAADAALAPAASAPADPVVVEAEENVRALHELDELAAQASADLGIQVDPEDLVRAGVTR